MTKLLSGRVKKVGSANVSSTRYSFIQLSETEPDLGLPAANGYVLSGNTNGQRLWIQPLTAADVLTVVQQNSPNLQSSSINELLDVDTATVPPGTGEVLTWNGTRWVANAASISSTQLANIANTVVGIVGAAVTANNAQYANVATFANTAGQVLTLSNFTTSNLDEGVNLYYADYRARAAISALDGSIEYYSSNGKIRATANITASLAALTTANIPEVASNLYFTNARVVAAVTGTTLSNLTVSGNINAGNIISVGGSITGANLISASYIQANSWIGLYTANVIESSTGLYYTNARVYSNISPLLSAKANVTDLTTANVNELASSGNLYYNNNRVRANVIELLPTLAGNNIIIAANGQISANLTSVSVSISTVTGNLAVTGNLNVTDAVNATSFIAGTGFVGNITGANSIVTNYINANVWQGLYTANVIESASGLYYTNARVYSNVIGIIGNKANVTDLTTANVIESSSNLYYTNARSRAALTAGLGISYDTATGIISTTQDTSATGTVVFANLTVTGQTTFYGNVTTHTSNNLSVSDNMIYLNSGSESSNPDLGFAGNYNDGSYHHAGFFRDASDAGTWKVFENYSPEPDANVFIDTAHASFRLANLSATTFFGNVQGTVSTLSNFTTSDLTEGNNLYFTNTRVNSNILALLPTLAGDNINIAANGRISSNAAAIVGAITSLNGNITVAGNLLVTNAISANVWNNLYTANVQESSTGLYYTNGRVSSYVTPLLTTANVVESTNNLYYTNSRVYSNVIALLPTLAGNNIIIAANGQISANTAGLAQGLGSAISTLTGNIAVAGNLLVTNAISANVWNNLYTANVIESASNLYYTNARVYANVTPLLATKANVVDLTTANVRESASNLYFTNARVYSNVIALMPTLAGNNIIIAANGQISANLTNLVLSNVRGNISVSGNLVATGSIIGDNIQTTGIGTPTIYSDTNIVFNAQNTVASGNIVTTQAIYAGALFINGNPLGAGGLGSSALDDLTDVVISSPVANQVLKYDTGTNKWINAAPSASTNSFDGDVTITNGNLTVMGTAFVGGIVVNGREVVSGGETGANITIGQVTSNIWTGIYTANVIETDSNLYYTNDRVRSNVIDLLPTLAGSGISISANGVISVSTGGGGGGAIVSSSDLTTANVSELASSGNLYYTNARVYANISPLLSAKANVTDLTTANVIESASSLYYTNARVYSNVAPLLAEKANVTDLTTANVVESASALYYTNARTRSTLSGGTGINYDPVTGIISSGQDVSTTGTVTFANLTVTGQTNFYGNVITHTSNNLSVSDNMIYLNSGSESSNPDLGIAGNYNDGTYHHAGFFRDASDNGTWKVFENYSPEPDSNIFINTAHASFRLANLSATTFIGNVQGTVSTLSNFSTSNLAEGSNLYYTNARVYANVIGLINGKANVVDLTTANVIESAANLYFTNARTTTAVVNSTLSNISVTGNVVAGNIITGSGFGGSVTGANLISAAYIQGNIWQGLYTANVIESASNLYFTNARVYANVIGLIGGKANIVDLTTANVIESASNLYYTNARVYANVAPLLVAKANVVDLTTANVIEASSGLYYTNARVYSNVIALLPSLAGTGITIAANGRIDSFTSVSNVWANLWVTGNVNAGNVIANNFVSAGNGSGSISSTGNFSINAAGNIILNANSVVANNFVSTGSGASYITSTSNFVITSASNITLTANTILTSNINANSITTPSITATVWNGLYTSNIIESGNTNTGNVFFSNTRARAAFIAGGNITIDANGVISSTAGVSNAISNVTSNLIVTGNITAGNVISNAFISTGNGAGSISSTGNFSINATGNIILNANNVVANNFVSTGAGSSYITSTSNLSISAPNVVVSSGNFIVSGNITAANFIGNVSASITNLNSFTTSNLNEGSNLYYTNARVRSTLSAGDGTIIYDPVAGTIRAAANVTATITQSLANVTTANVSEDAASGNLYYTNSRVRSNVIALLPTLAGSGISIAANGQISSTVGNGGTVVTTADLTTANVREASSNLYYTNARVFSALSGDTGVSYNNTTGVISIGQNVATTANVTFAQLNVTGITNFYGNVITHTSNNLSISDNMIYLNAGSEASNPDLGIAGNYNDGTYHHAGFFRDASDSGTWKVFENYSPEPDANIFIDTAHATFRLANIAATTFIGNVQGTVSTLSNFTTSNLTEGTNLYYTNTRARSAFTAGNNITIAANGQISANVSSSGGTTSSNLSSNITITALQFVGTGSQTTFSLAANTTASNIIVTVDGLVLTPTFDYTTSGNVLTISSAPPLSTNVVVRYFEGVNITNTTGGTSSGTSSTTATSYAFARIFA